MEYEFLDELKRGMTPEEFEPYCRAQMGQMDISYESFTSVNPEEVVQSMTEAYKEEYENFNGMERDYFEYVEFLEHGWDVFDFEAYMVEELQKAQNSDPEFYTESMVDEILYAKTTEFENEWKVYHKED